MSDQASQKSARTRRKKLARKKARAFARHSEANAFLVLRHQRVLGLGATISILGLAMVGTHDSKSGSMVVIIGLLILMWGVHRFGRLGSERITS